MVRRVKHEVVVGPGGAIQILDPSLPIGSRAEVVIQFEAPELSPAERLALFRKLQKSMNLTKEQADAWVAEVKAEREARRLPQ